MTEQREIDLCARLDNYRIPQLLHEGLVRYLLHGIRPGGYLCSVLSNDLGGAILRAAHPVTPDVTRRLVKFLTYCAPAPCHGAAANVEAWISIDDRAPMCLDDGPETLDDELPVIPMTMTRDRDEFLFVDANGDTWRLRPTHDQFVLEISAERRA
jgi:hypothetical protein